MGYDFHITRREHWAQGGSDITEAEWLDYVSSDGELTPMPANGPCFAFWESSGKQEKSWLDWHNGQIYTKNPSQLMLEKMVSIASELKAVVQGDDGEIYSGPANSKTYPPSGSRPNLKFKPTIFTWLGSLRFWHRPRSTKVALSFNAGDRVRDVWGHEHTVLEILPDAEHGLGLIKTRRDDGVQLSHAVIAHGLTKIDAP